MKVYELPTPAILLDMNVLERNIKKFQSMCDQNGKELWPMLKTHKSLAIAKMQSDAGAAGFLCGTLDECEALCEAGYKKLMYAYPVASRFSAKRVIELSRKCSFIIRLDTTEAAGIVNAAASEAGVIVSYTIIVDCGLHRFGIAPNKVGEFAEKLKDFTNLRFVGISTHPGAVYASTKADEVSQYVKAEADALQIAADILRQSGLEPEIISSGSTPTFTESVRNPSIGIYHPGNYIYNDCIQISIESAKEEDCALTVLATVISRSAEGHYVCDAGAKCLGLDQGAHGNDSIIGHGRVIGHPELIVSALSEEVGKLSVKAGATTDLKVGEQIRIIPNHSCSTANLTDHYITVRGENVEGTVYVDIRGNRCNWNL
ncbi:MAG: amino-acid racemase [Ruminococcaceae bacterium]|nr:amino-acid racemase [Oscillospiraceae bacterium]